MRNSPTPTLPNFWLNLLFIRHGESTCNEVNRFAGSVDAPLTQLGRAQAEEAARTFKGPLPDLLFVSNLSRARETAEILFPQAETGLIHEVDARLAERHFGEFTLSNKSELQAIHGIRDYDEALYDLNGTIEGAESFANFQHRVEQFLTETVTPLLMSGEKVIVVSHKYVIELMVRLILNLPRQDGYDLRLPNSKILNAGDALRYYQKESRIGNRFREWVVLHHGEALASAGLLGLGVSAFLGPLNIPWQLGFVLLMVATLITLLRVDLAQAARSKRSDWNRSVLRYALIPGLAALFTSTTDAPAWWIVIALILATPTALTSVTLSRCAGGMVHPAVGTMMRSTLIGSITVLVMIGIFFDWKASAPILFVAISAIGLPCVLSHGLRKLKPIFAANFSERQAAWSIILLSVFVGISCAQLNLSDMFTTGTLAVGLSVVLRMLSAALTRWSSCVAPDDYLSLGFPNLFILVIIGQILGLSELTTFATWLLVPMFLLSPFDIWICRRLAAKGRGDWSLQGYLRLGHSNPESNFCPSIYQNIPEKN